MARSRKGPSRTRRASKPKPTFRGRVPADVVDQLLYRFVALVKHGLELMLQTPSALARDEFDQHPEWVYAPTDIPILVAWTAQAAYEMAWPVFCQHVLGHPDWQTLLGVQSQADLDALAVGFEQVRMRCIELAIHDALKEGDKRDTRPADQRPAVQDEFAQFIGASQALKLLKKRLRPLLERVDAKPAASTPSAPRRSDALLLMGGCPALAGASGFHRRVDSQAPAASPLGGGGQLGAGAHPQQGNVQSASDGDPAGRLAGDPARTRPHPDADESVGRTGLGAGPDTPALVQQCQQGIS